MNISCDFSCKCVHAVYHTYILLHLLFMRVDRRGTRDYLCHLRRENVIGLSELSLGSVKTDNEIWEAFGSWSKKVNIWFRLDEMNNRNSCLNLREYIYIELRVLYIPVAYTGRHIDLSRLVLQPVICILWLLTRWIIYLVYCFFPRLISFIWPVLRRSPMRHRKGFTLVCFCCFPRTTAVELGSLTVVFLWNVKNFLIKITGPKNKGCITRFFLLFVSHAGNVSDLEIRIFNLYLHYLNHLTGFLCYSLRLWRLKWSVIFLIFCSAVPGRAD